MREIRNRLYKLLKTLVFNSLNNSANIIGAGNDQNKVYKPRSKVFFNTLNAIGSLKRSEVLYPTHSLPKSLGCVEIFESD